MKNSVKWINLTAGGTVMLFIGIIYAWSILKVPFSTEFRWSESVLAFNFTLTMIFFCLGQLFAGMLSRFIPLKLIMFLSACSVSAGFMITSFITGSFPVLLFLSYGFLGGLGMGIMFNLSISICGAWFPRNRGTCIGMLMMCFGTSTLITGKAAALLFSIAGWHTTYRIISITAGIIIAAAALIMRYPEADGSISIDNKSREAAYCCTNPQYTSAEMVKKSSFRFLFIFLIMASSLGNSTISMARDVALYEKVSENLVPLAVGILSLCNGLGRLALGIICDRKGVPFALRFDACITVSAAAASIAALYIGGLFSTLFSFCLVGFSYGCQPIITSSAVSELYGEEYFTMNFAIANTSIIVTALITSLSGTLFAVTHSFYVPYFMLFLFALCALLL